MIKKNYSIRSFHIAEKTKCFIVKKDKIFLLNNYDVEGRNFVGYFKAVQLHNLFVFSSTDPLFQEKIMIEDNYLLDIFTYNNLIGIVGVNRTINVNLIINLALLHVGYRLQNKV